MTLQFGASLTDDARSVNYDRNTFITQATGLNVRKELLSSGLYYKHVTIVTYASSSVNKLKASLNDAARGVIYVRHVFIIQATDPNLLLDGLEIMEPREKVIRPPF